jgi:Flp pilus assembly protein TadD
MKWSPSTRIWLGLVLVVAAAAYVPALGGPQLLDDAQAIDANPSIRELWPVSIPLNPPSQIPTSGRPVANYSLALNYWLNASLGVNQEPDPGGPHKTVSYHIVNLLIHLACGLLLFGIVRRTLWTGRLGDQWRPRAGSAALLVTAFWLVHPLQTDAVDYLVQRTELLMAFCYLLTLYASLRAWDAPPGRRATGWYLLGATACLLGMGSKEVMATAPIMIVLYDRVFRLDHWSALLAPPQRRRRWFYAALAASWIVLALLVASGPRNRSVGFTGEIPWWDYLHSQGWAIARYLRLALVPNALSLDYGPRPIAHWLGIPGLLLVALLATGTLLAWRRVRRWGWLAFLGSWFLLILAPSSSVVPITSEIAAERRMYLPLAAVIVALVVAAYRLMDWGVQRGWRVLATTRTAAGIAAGVVAALAALTFARSTLYRSPEAIWQNAVRHVPANARGWNNLGVLISDASSTRLAEADADYRQAMAIEPGFIDARLNLVSDAFRQRDYDSAAAELRQLPLDAGSESALAGFGAAQLARGDTAAALLVFQRAADDRGNGDAAVNLGMTLRLLRRPADAAAALQRAVALDPNRPELLTVLGEMLLAAAHAEMAEPYLQRAVALAPRSVQTLNTLAGVELALSKAGQAALLYRRVLQLDPTNAQAIAGLAQAGSGRARH